MQAVNLQGLLLFSWKGGFSMPQFNKHGNRIRASDKSLVFSFLGWFAAHAVFYGGYVVEPKDNHYNRLEIGQPFSRWQRPFYGYTIYDSYYYYGGFSLWTGCTFIPQIPA